MRIGVICGKSERFAMAEFFELFKTPSEEYRNAADYDVVLVTDPESPVPPAKLRIVFGSKETSVDRQTGVKILQVSSGDTFQWKEAHAPLYGKAAGLEGPGEPFLFGKNGSILGMTSERRGEITVRLGYDLFAEVDTLLRKGQPAENALVPALDIHIDVLRDRILEHGIPLVEIPPTPYGHDFITCLTHDIDFMGIRDHKFDHTMFGFVYRSLVPKYLKGLDRKTRFLRYRKNIKALFSLPLVHAGVVPDFWYPLERYREVEEDLRSTFFFLPFGNRPGTSPDGRTSIRRACRYDVRRFAEPIRSIVRSGNEVALHGIDSWRDSRKGVEELGVIRRITGGSRVGVRMHWLYFSDETPKHLEEAGVYYDSTLGYNDAVGFRSGTTQVFILPGTDTVYELPLNVQDTAMFYPGRMNVSESRAFEMCGKVLSAVKARGGVFTVNWHDRSLAPERNWDVAYIELLGMLRREKTWFATASEAVAWNEKRRSVRFVHPDAKNVLAERKPGSPAAGAGPPLALRVHTPVTVSGGERTRSACVDHPLNPGQEFAAGF